ncbi:MAG: class I SAM-dependent methyltransferase [Methylococcaceae bacterium]|nr:class I SAM-dependent methyltransferase [Methylococcaceae bacterium]
MDPSAYREMAETQDRHWWFRGRREVLANLIGRLGLPTDAQILEIGAGTGGNLDMLAAFGSVSALEMDQYAREFATAKTGGSVDIRDGRLPDRIPFENSRYDLVCLFDVLEHVDDDRAALAAIRPLVKPGGHLLLTVPAYRWLWGKHDEKLHHQRRYTAKELARRAIETGWTVRKLSYFNTLLFPLAAVGRLADKLNPGGEALGSSTPAPFVNELLFRLFSAEQYLLPRLDLPFGVSLVALLTHP